MRSAEFLPPKLIQAIGLIGLVVIGVFWGITTRLDPLLLATAGSLVTGGNILEAYLKIRADKPATE